MIRLFKLSFQMHWPNNDDDDDDDDVDDEDDDADGEEGHLALVWSGELCAGGYKVSQQLSRAENNNN